MELFIHLYLVNFIRTLIIIAVIYYAIRLFTRYVLPHILNKKINEMQQKMQEQQKRQQRGNRPEGDVTLEFDKRRNKGDRDDEGEYVDFEEIE